MKVTPKCLLRGARASVRRSTFLAIALGLTSSTLTQLAIAETSFQPLKLWRELSPSPDFANSPTLSFYEFSTPNGSSAFVAVFDLSDTKKSIRPYFNKTTGTVMSVARKEKAAVAINGGYFNLSDGVSTSFVTIDSKTQCDPTTNHDLITNPKLKPYLPTIFNRSELRILKDKSGQLKLSISDHQAPIENGYRLLHSLQGGPKLLPDSTERKEAFLRKAPDGKLTDSIGCERTAARTAVGITSDNHFMLLCIAGKGQSEFSSGVTLNQLQTTLKTLGCAEALNLDGGTSTTMVVKLSDGYQKVCGKTPDKLVKSCLLIEDE